MIEHFAPQILTVDPERAGQRLDNFLFALFRTLPKSHIYRWIRKGEVRVNKGRAKPDYRINPLDQIRIPPLHLNRQSEPKSQASGRLLSQLTQSILFEDDEILAINKPAGIAVHGGSGLSLGVIEAMRQLRPDLRHLELAHRLDKDTSGCLILIKKRHALKAFHQALLANQVEKLYHAIVVGRWSKRKQHVDAKLRKNILQSGERMVQVDEESGKKARTEFTVLSHLNKASYIQAKPISGRTHQIRVHCQSAGHSIIGDAKYGASDLELALNIPIKRMFLHAKSLSFQLPHQPSALHLEAPLPDAWQQMLAHLSLNTD